MMPGTLQSRSGGYQNQTQWDSTVLEGSGWVWAEVYKSCSGSWVVFGYEIQSAFWV